MAETVALKVAMSCQGCVGAVNRVLTKLEGVESFDINLEQQKVTVRSNLPADVVLEKVSKSGKKTAFWVEEPKETAPDAKPADGSAVAETPAAAPEATPKVEADPEVKVVPSETPAANGDALAPASG